MKNFLVLLIFVPLIGFSQKNNQWYNEFQKTETHYHFGRYFQASAKAKQILKKIDKKGEFAAFKLPSKALHLKYEAAIGLRLENDTALINIINQWDTTTSSKTDSFMLVGNYCMATAAFSFQIFDQAKKHYQEALKYINTTSDPNGYWEQEIRIAETELFIETMNYNEAKKRITPIIEYQKSITNREQISLSTDTNLTKIIKLKKKEYKNRFRTLGLLMVMKGDIALGRGDLKTADSIYTENDSLLLTELNKKDISLTLNHYGYIKSQILQARALTALDLIDVRKKYATNVKYSIPNLKYLDIFKSEIIADAEFNYFSKYKRAYKQHQREVNYYFPVRSSHIFYGNYLSHLESFYKEKYKAYGKQMAKQALTLNQYYSNTDAGQIPFLYDLAQSLINIYQFNAAKFTFLKILDIVGFNNSDSSGVFYHANLEFASFLLNYTTEYNTADSLFSKFFEPFVLKELNPYHPLYIKYLNDYALIDSKLDRFKSAITKYNQLAEITQNKFGLKSEEYALVLQHLAKAQIGIGDYNSSQKNLITAIDLLQSIKRTKNINYILTQEAIGKLYAFNGNFTKAENYILEAYESSSKYQSANDMLPININESLAELYIGTGKYKEAEAILKESVSYKTNTLGENTSKLINVYALLGKINLIKGDLITAEYFIKKSIQISKNIYGIESLQYLEHQILLGGLYQQMGYLKKSLKTYNQTIKEYESKFGKNYFKVAPLLIQKSKVRLLANKNSLSLITDLNRSGEIITTNVSDHHPLIGAVAEVKSQVYIHDSNYKLALIQLQTANLIYTSSYGSNHFKTANNQLNLATLYIHQKDYENALKYNNKALAIYENLYGKSHPKYLFTISQKSKIYYALKNYTKAIENIRFATQQHITYINNSFPYLLDSERTKYWNSVKEDFELFNIIAINHYQEDNTIISQMYSNWLITKNILFNASSQFKYQILASNNQDLISAYHYWISKKDSLLITQNLTKKQADTSSLNLQELENEVNTLEKELKTNFTEYQFTNNNTNWNSVKNKLATNQAAIEIIRVNYFESNLTDSVIYIGLIITKETRNQPDIVIIPNGHEIESTHFTNYWIPFEAKLKNKKIISISPDGVYKQLTPNSIDKSNSENKHIFQFISSTKYLK